MAIAAYGISLAPFTSFNYLGRFLLMEGDNWPSVVHNFRREQQKWAWLSWVLNREGADSQTLGRIDVRGVQAFMLYRSEMWVMTLRIGRVLGGFYNRVARRMTWRKPHRRRDGEWVYPLLEEAMAE